MKIVEGLVQGSEAWHKFRETHLGASNSAPILGMSQYQTAVDIFNDKTSRNFPVQMNDAMRAGVEMEPKIREAWEFMTGMKFETPTAEHDDYPFISASFDGYHAATNSIIEIKHSLYPKLVNCIGKQDLGHFKEVYPSYFVQCQHQMFVSGSKECTLVTMDKELYLLSLVIPRDDEFINDTLIPTVVNFWNNHVLTDIAPETTEDDFVYIDNPEALELAETLAEALQTAKNAKDVAVQAKKELIELTDDGNSIIGPIKLTKTYGVRTDYKTACDDAGLDLNNYKSEYIRWTPRRIK